MKNIFKKLLLLSISIYPSYILSQATQFDESFLKSLPEEVRADLISETSMRDQLEEVQYRRPSTFIKKPSPAVASSRFGSQIFSMMQTTLMPTNEPNFDGSYILDYGDILELQFVGQKSSIIKLPVKRDGSINIPEIGKIFLSGLSLDKASDLIKSKVNLSYIGVEAFVTLINIRDIQVIVAGNVYNPGPYTLNGNSSIFHALSVSGGPSEIGSFRSINLVRDNKVIEEIDLYDTFMMGINGFNTRLRSGDLIFINPVSNLVSISGGVKRPGIYELKSSDRLIKIVDYANGLSNKADLSEINLFRLSEGRVISLVIKNLEELKTYKPNDYDKLVIREFPYRSVAINGAIANPGAYLINEGDGLLELVEQAGGYTLTAYPFGGVLNNRTTKNINSMAVSELYNSFLNSISQNVSNESGMTGVLEIMNILKNTPVSGRVSAEFDLSVLKDDPSQDIQLQNGDEIIIPELPDQIYVYGEVSSQGTTKYQKGKELSYYIAKKGGFNQLADPKAIFILSPNGETIRVEPSRRNIFTTNRKQDYVIYPGSVIFIPRKTSNPMMASKTALAYASVLGNLGVTLASLSVLKQ